MYQPKGLGGGWESVSKGEGMRNSRERAENRILDMKQRNLDNPFPKLYSFVPSNSDQNTPWEEREIGLGKLLIRIKAACFIDL